jgi:hypothetical protein
MTWSSPLAASACSVSRLSRSRGERCAYFEKRGRCIDEAPDPGGVCSRYDRGDTVAGAGQADRVDQVAEDGLDAGFLKNDGGFRAAD